MSGIYLSVWQVDLRTGNWQEQISVGPHGLFYACEGMRRMRGMVVDLDAARMLVDYTRSEPWDIGPRCPRPECTELCQDASDHVDAAMAAWEPGPGDGPAGPRPGGPAGPRPLPPRPPQPPRPRAANVGGSHIRRSQS